MDENQYIETNVTSLASGILAAQGSDSLTDESRALVIAGIRAGLSLQRKVETISFLQESYCLESFEEAAEMLQKWVATKAKSDTVSA